MAQSSILTDLKASILGMKSQTYLAYADYSKLQNFSINSGSIILETQKDSFEQTVQSLERICANDSTTTNSTATFSVCGDCETFDNCKTFTHDSKKDTYNNSTNSNQSTFSKGDWIGFDEFGTAKFSDNTNSNSTLSTYSESYGSPRNGCQVCFWRDNFSYSYGRVTSFNQTSTSKWGTINTNYQTNSASASGNTTFSRRYDSQGCGDFTQHSTDGTTSRCNTNTTTSNTTYGVRT